MSTPSEAGIDLDRINAVIAKGNFVEAFYLGLASAYCVEHHVPMDDEVFEKAHQLAADRDLIRVQDGADIISWLSCRARGPKPPRRRRES